MKREDIMFYPGDKVYFIKDDVEYSGTITCFEPWDGSHFSCTVKAGKEMEIYPDTPESIKPLTKLWKALK